jgi:hypothetical protein
MYVCIADMDTFITSGQEKMGIVTGGIRRRMT